MRLWTGEALRQAVGGRVQGVLPQSISNIAIDSRLCPAGAAFFAVQGERADGHAYIAAAAQAGAALAVVEEAKLGSLPPLALPLLVVDNVLTALENLARAARARLQPGAFVSAITGSVGKTTVKEMLARALAPFGRVHLSPASFNNHFGVPLSLARMPENTDFGIYEIGMNHAGEITPLVNMVRPHLALITRIAAAHMGHFNSLAEIAAAKAEIFSGLAPGGTALINRDDEYYQFLREKLQEIGSYLLQSFGRNSEANYHIMAGSDKQQAEKQEFAVQTPFGQEIFHLHVQGTHMMLNATAVIAAAAELAIRPQYEKQGSHIVKPYLAKIKTALADFHAGAGRGARYYLPLPHKSAAKGEFLLIDESYNANPLSMALALKMLGEAKPEAGGRHIAVLGDMLELGPETQSAHEALAARLAAAKVELVFLAGEAMRFLQQKLQQHHPAIEVHWRPTAAELIAPVENALQAGDCVMVKSSNSIGTAKLVAALLAGRQVR
ncbi:UDP-N-acetylmuramoylalanyl-D-glutamyl-2, 6-diaminopimelate--D-alanyl-D-alanine ligase [Candidatus Tokpelaia sp.]|nr:UDP-N-acetylmuramoylalanyl-D-glutamyl-2, 6-diaminopimelate--D-alanyl-D-alanine ligase [Candidatus Tokpelaia sp.]